MDVAPKAREESLPADWQAGLRASSVNPAPTFQSVNRVASPIVQYEA